MIFKASLDKLAKGVTIGVSILFGAIIIAQVYSMASGSFIVSSIIITSLLVIYFATYVFRPIHYEVTSDQLLIHRIFSDVIIKRIDILNVEPLHKDQLKWTIRTFGVGGLYGYYGKFVNSKLGNMTWYVTRRDNVVLVETTNDKKIVLSPKDVSSFVQSLTVVSL